MTAAENARRHTFTVVAITGLLLLSIAGCNHTSQNPTTVTPPQNPPPEHLLSASDTPIVISGGSVHFRARKSGWTKCPLNGTNCYEATFDPQKKQTLTYYELVDEAFNEVPYQVTKAQTVTSGWEVDIWDTNGGNPTQTTPTQPAPTQPMKYGVLVCAEANSTYTACNTGSFSNGFPTKYIYVIAIGGAFKAPTGPDAKNPNRLTYEDGTKKQDYGFISNIYLNASGGMGGQQVPCADSACSLFLSGAPSQ